MSFFSECPQQQPNEESPLIGRNTPTRELEQSEEHRAKDFQLIGVPHREKAVSYILISATIEHAQYVRKLCLLYLL